MSKMTNDGLTRSSRSAL